VAKKVINFFLEDSAQEAFIPPLFERLVVEEGFTFGDFQFKKSYYEMYLKLRMSNLL
jgi:hypothetical protein